VAEAGALPFVVAHFDDRFGFDRRPRQTLLLLPAIGRPDWVGTGIANYQRQNMRGHLGLTFLC
jgi:hypothetical protein